MNELATFTDKLDSNLVQNADGVWCMSSLAIAELTGKRHDNVMRDIRNMLEELKIDQPKFGQIEKFANNREREIFNLPKHECMVLVTGYSAKLRSAVLKRWQLLEDAEAERQQAALTQAHEALAKSQQDYTHLSFQIVTGRSTVRADMFDWKRRFALITSAYSKKPDEYWFKHTPKEAVDLLAPYAEEAIRLISIALNARMALGTSMLKCGVDVDVVHKVLEEFITYVHREAKDTDGHTR